MLACSNERNESRRPQVRSSDTRLTPELPELASCKEGACAPSRTPARTRIRCRQMQLQAWPPNSAHPKYGDTEEWNEDNEADDQIDQPIQSGDPFPTRSEVEASVCDKRHSVREYYKIHPEKLSGHRVEAQN